MNRWLGLDYGKKRVGVAISDPLGMFAQGLTTLPFRNDRDLVDRIRTVISDYPELAGIVIGLPLKTTGEKSDSSESVEAFIVLLEQTIDLPVVKEDERFTSHIAQQALRAQGVQPSRNKGLVDQTAAALILQGFLDKRSRQSQTDEA